MERDCLSAERARATAAGSGPAAASFPYRALLYFIPFSFLIIGQSRRLISTH